jgi:hypothetical protein
MCDKLEFARIRFAAEGFSRITLRAARLASLEIDGEDRLLLLSAVGAETAVKAVRGLLLANNVQPTAGWYRVGDERHRRLHKDEAGYRAAISRLAAGVFHLMVTTKRPGFLARLDEASLWAELISDRYTTPLLRPWVPWLRQRLEEEDLLQQADGHASEAGLLSATTEDLDELVSEGVRRGVLKLEEEEVIHGDLQRR